MSDLEHQKRSGPLPITAEEFDRKVEAGEDIDDYIDWDKAVMVAPGELSPGQKLSMIQELVGDLLSSGSLPPSISLDSEGLSITMPIRVRLKFSGEAIRQDVPYEAPVHPRLAERVNEQEAIK